MSRKVRRVPKDWQHPKKKSYNYEQGFEMESYQPMFDQPFGPEMERWYAEWKSWEAGTHPDKPGHDFPLLGLERRTARSCLLPSRLAGGDAHASDDVREYERRYAHQPGL